MAKYCWYYEYPIGKIGVAETDGYIVGVFFADGADGSAGGFELFESETIKKTARQLEEYFAGERREFDLPLAFTGTEFQNLVWEALMLIPYGETRTYGWIAAQIGNPKGARAVGMANNRNPIVVICPCHRVIGKSGGLVGYGGGLPVKKYLLDLESARR